MTTKKGKGRPTKYKESDMEDIIFNDLAKYIGPHSKKKRQLPPVLPFLNDIEKNYGYGFNNTKNAFSNFRRPDILAESADGILSIIEIKKLGDSWQRAAIGIVQLLEYNRMAIQQGKRDSENIRLFLIIDRIPVEIYSLLDFYEIPINLIEFNYLDSSAEE